MSDDTYALGAVRPPRAAARSGRPWQERRRHDPGPRRLGLRHPRRGERVPPRRCRGSPRGL